MSGSPFNPRECSGERTSQIEWVPVTLGQARPERGAPVAHHSRPMRDVRGTDSGMRTRVVRTRMPEDQHMRVGPGRRGAGDRGANWQEFAG